MLTYLLIFLKPGKALPGATILKLVPGQPGSAGKPTAIIGTSLQSSGGVTNVLAAAGTQQQSQQQAVLQQVGLLSGVLAIPPVDTFAYSFFAQLLIVIL